MLSEETMNEEKKTEPVEQPVVAKKVAPGEELADTVNQFFSSMTAATQQTLKSMLAQFAAKADAAIAKLDEAAGGAPPKKPDEVADGTPPKKQDG